VIRCLIGTLALATVVTTAHALNPAEIDDIMKRHAHQAFAPAPYVLIDTYEPSEALGNALMVGGSDYRFGLYSCRQWIPTYLFMQQHNGEPVDRAFIDAKCSNEHLFRLVVVREDGTKVGDATRVALTVGGRKLTEQSSDHRELGTEVWTSAFDLAELNEAKKVELTVYLEGQFLYRKQIASWLVKSFVQGSNTAVPLPIAP